VLEELESRLLPATAYYISPLGDDTNSGTSPADAWQSIDRVNQQVFGPGDSVNFQGGAGYQGSLLFGPQDAGTPDNPITVTSYGPGRATILPGTGVGILIQDTGGFTISNLNVTGSGMDTNQDYGIHLLNDGAGGTVPGYFNHLYLDSLDVSGFGNYGVTIDCQSNTSGFQDVQLTNSQLHDNLLGGLVMFSPYYYDTTTTAQMVQGLYVGHVNAYNNPGSPTSPVGSGNGLLIAGVNGGVVERCECHDNGGPQAHGNVGGILVTDSTAVVVQYNEAYANRTGTNTDGDAFDLDWDTTGCTLQYNYAHDNDGTGYLLIGYNTLHDSYPPQSGNTVRYNISENDGRNNSYPSIYVAGPVDDAEIYNNTVYVSPAPTGTPVAVALSRWSGFSVHFRNNIFYVTGGLPLINTAGTNTGTDLLFQNNDYYTDSGPFEIDYNDVPYGSLAAWRAGTGQERLDGQDMGTSANPGLVDAGQGGTIGNADLLDTLTAYHIQKSSPLKHAGLDLGLYFGIDPGLYDFFGGSIPTGHWYTIGADGGG
jgi:hypothetical protein